MWLVGHSFRIGCGVGKTAIRGKGSWLNGDRVGRQNWSWRCNLQCVRHLNLAWSVLFHSCMSLVSNVHTCFHYYWPIPFLVECLSAANIYEGGCIFLCCSSPGLGATEVSGFWVMGRVWQGFTPLQLASIHVEDCNAEISGNARDSHHGTNRERPT